jgi:hypothetical protein
MVYIPLLQAFWNYVVQSTSILGLDSDLDLEPPILIGIFGSDYILHPRACIALA